MSQKKFAAHGFSCGKEGNFPASHACTLDLGLGQGGRGLHGLEVLRSKPGVIAFGPDIVNTQRLAKKGGEGHGRAHDRPAPGFLPAVHRPHDPGEYLRPKTRETGKSPILPWNALKDQV